MSDDELRLDIGRTLEIVRQLATGKTLTLPNGSVLAMGEDMSIGILWTNYSTPYPYEQHISGLSTMDLAGLNRLLTKFDIWPIIPGAQRTGAPAKLSEVREE